MEEQHPGEEDVNEINTTLLELQDALTAALRETGVLGKLRAQLRAAAVSVVRGDPHLREAAVSAGKIMQINDKQISLEGRLALLMMEDFMRVHGMLHSLGVLAAESNVSMVGETERTTLQQMRTRLFNKEDNNNNNNMSILERLIANTLQRDKPVVRSASTGSSSISLTPPEQSKEIEEEEEIDEKKEKEKEIPHNVEIITELQEYDDSVDFSDVSVADMSSVDITAYDYIEKF
ncbi:hypothetical protein LSM04_001311 [Trypanosoma melophagium]|uniref:uncharacterized protein n=1 Tax=Trypanosoma melophagium TaxID=715481 RepID=UPI00351A152D|nr:hypothetical protein LSM04_001311 [Trypanosoma melophagium]